MKLGEKIKSEALAHAKKELPYESVGIVYRVKDDEIYYPCKNESENPKYSFTLSPSDYLKCVIKGDIVAIIHSHPTTKPLPSDDDIKVCKRGNTMWFIVNPVTEEWGSCDPSECKD